MLEINLPSDVDSLEIGIRRSIDIIQQGCIVGIKLPALEQGYVFPGWPIYSKTGYPAKFVPVGKKNEIHRFTAIKAPEIRGQLIQLFVTPMTEERIPISQIAVLGNTPGKHRYVWDFEVSND